LQKTLLLWTKKDAFHSNFELLAKSTLIEILNRLPEEVDSKGLFCRKIQSLTRGFLTRLDIKNGLKVIVSKKNNVINSNYNKNYCSYSIINITKSNSNNNKKNITILKKITMKCGFIYKNTISYLFSVRTGFSCSVRTIFAYDIKKDKYLKIKLCTPFAPFKEAGKSLKSDFYLKIECRSIVYFEGLNLIF
jgi:hypothetical protein